MNLHQIRTHTHRDSAKKKTREATNTNNENKQPNDGQPKPEVRVSHKFAVSSGEHHEETASVHKILFIYIKERS